MAIKKSPRHRVRKLDMAKFYELHQVREGRRWNIDDLEESGLDLMLFVADEPLCSLVDEHVEESKEESEGESEEESEEEIEEEMDHSSTWPFKRATKKDESKSCFLDLPPEIRLQIYELYCRSVLEDLRFHHMPASMHNICRGTPARSLKPRLICHQICSEFTLAWAQCQTFLLSAPWAHYAPNLDGVWFHLRDFLEWMGPGARHHVRTIRVFKTQSVDFPRWDPYDWRPYAPMLHARTADFIRSKLERLIDVHKDLKIEVEIRYQAFHDAPNFRALRRMFTMRQRPFGRHQTPDWTCDVGDVQTTEVLYNVDRLSNFQSPKSPHCKDEIWKLKEDTDQQEHS